METVFRTKIVGNYHLNEDAKQAYRSLDEDDTNLILQREEDNKYDPNAVKVLVEDIFGDYTHVGYIPKEVSVFLADMLDDGRTFMLTYKGKGSILVEEIA